MSDESDQFQLLIDRVAERIAHALDSFPEHTFASEGVMTSTVSLPPITNQNLVPRAVQVLQGRLAGRGLIFAYTTGAGSLTVTRVVGSGESTQPTRPPDSTPSTPSAPALGSDKTLQLLLLYDVLSLALDFCLQQGWNRDDTMELMGLLVGIAALVQQILK